MVNVNIISQGSKTNRTDTILLGINLLKFLLRDAVSREYPAKPSPLFDFRSVFPYSLPFYIFRIISQLPLFRSTAIRTTKASPLPGIAFSIKPMFAKGTPFLKGVAEN